MHMCVGNLSIIGSDNGLLPRRYQVIIWINAGILLIGSWWKKRQWNLDLKEYIFVKKDSFQNVASKMAAILSWPKYAKFM